jgi:predicted nucleic acid-binding protein
VFAPNLLPCKNLPSWVRDGGITLVEPGRSDYDRVIQLMDKYGDLPMDFTDGVVVAASERLGVKHIATVDGDFSTYRLNGRDKFINVFLRDP